MWRVVAGASFCTPQWLFGQGIDDNYDDDDDVSCVGINILLFKDYLHSDSVFL